jgi:hypothetical protein
MNLFHFKQIKEDLIGGEFSIKPGNNQFAHDMPPLKLGNLYRHGYDSRSSGFILKYGIRCLPSPESVLVPYVPMVKAAQRRAGPGKGWIMC